VQPRHVERQLLDVDHVAPVQVLHVEGGDGLGLVLDVSDLQLFAGDGDLLDFARRLAAGLCRLSRREGRVRLRLFPGCATLRLPFGRALSRRLRFSLAGCFRLAARALGLRRQDRTPAGWGAYAGPGNQKGQHGGDPQDPLVGVPVPTPASLPFRVRCSAGRLPGGLNQAMEGRQDPSRLPRAGAVGHARN
jgi:hypothetical protein